jgi:hypothetical protein
MSETIYLKLSEATTEQLRAALDDSEHSRIKCEAQGSFLHTWGRRSAAIRAELDRRAVTPGKGESK